MDLLITGGNGFVGRHLAEKLLARGERVRVLALPNEDTSALDQRITVYPGDICSPQTLAAAMEGAHGVVHLAAMMHVWKPLSEYERVNVDGTVNVCRKAMDSGVGRVVHMSSSTVYGMKSPGPIDESFPLAPFADPYSISKAKADRAVQSLIEGEGLQAVILRPDQIFGPGDRLHFGATASRLRSGRGVIVGRGDNLIPLVYVDDVVQALIRALDSSSALGEAFNVSADAPMTQRGFLDCVAEETGGSPARLRVPLRLLTTGGYLAERVVGALGGSRRPPITRLGAAFLGTSVCVSIDKARARLGYVPDVPLREGVRRTAIWYLNSLASGLPTDAHADAAMPASTGAIGL